MEFDPIKASLDHAARSIKQGNLKEGEVALQWVLNQQRDNVLALLWMTKCVHDDQAKIVFFKRVLEIEPTNPHALRGLELYGHKAPKGQSAASPSGPPFEPRSKQSREQTLPRSTLPPNTGPSSTSARERATPRRRPLAVIALSAVALLVAIAFAVNTLFVAPRVKAAAQFQERYDAFLAEAQKLAIMTQQGVSNSIFRNQLAEVKTAYTQVGDSWPQSMTVPEGLFDKAITGWELTLQVWDFGLALYPRNLEWVFLDYHEEGQRLLEACANYTGTDVESAKYTSVADWVAILMAEAGDYFASAKALAE